MPPTRASSAKPIRSLRSNPLPPAPPPRVTKPKPKQKPKPTKPKPEEVVVAAAVSSSSPSPSPPSPPREPTPPPTAKVEEAPPPPLAPVELAKPNSTPLAVQRESTPPPPPQPQVVQVVKQDHQDQDVDMAAQDLPPSPPASLPLPSFLSADPLSDVSDSSCSSDSDTGERKPPRPIKLDSKGLPRPRPSYYYDATYDPASALEGNKKKRGRRGGMKGIPVFEPTMEEFEGQGGFYGYVKRIEKYGMRSGVVKVIPPKAWTDALPSTSEPLRSIRLREPIEQHMVGSQGLYRVTNVAKSRIWNPAQWKQAADAPKYESPDFLGEKKKGDRSERKVEGWRGRKKGVAAASSTEKQGKGKGKEESVAEDDEEEEEEAMDADVEDAGQGQGGLRKPSRKGKEKVVEQDEDPEEGAKMLPSPPATEVDQQSHPDAPLSPPAEMMPHDHPSTSNNAIEIDPTPGPSASQHPSPSEPPASQPEPSQPTANSSPKKAAAKKRPTNLQRAEPTDAEWEEFTKHFEELPHGMKKEDYTIELMREVERRYWRTLTFGEPAMYGADMKGSLFDDSTKAWNVASLGDLLPRLAPAACRIPGVVSPYLYFGMWRATFAWHVEDADLYSINYIHFGAPKFWYSVPQELSERFERVMEGFFPTDRAKCSQFLRHKAFLASPRLLANHNITLNRCVQLPGEFILTYPKGYHSGFNLGFNAAESINFATERWLPLGKTAKSCTCIGDSVNIDVEVWLKEAALAEAVVKDEALGILKRKRASLVPAVDGAPPPEKKKRIRNRKAADGAGAPAAPTSTSQLGVAAVPSPANDAVPPAIGSDAALSVVPRPFGVADVLPRALVAAPPTPSTSISAPTAAQLSGPSAVSVIVPKLSKKALKLLELAKKEAGWACALCPDLSAEGLVRIGEPGVKMKKELKAHRVCVMFTPATWIDEDPETKEEIVRGYGKIEKARWKLNCQLCKEGHGTKVQCTKGKCPKAFHVTCALAEGSGVFLDATVAGNVSILQEVRKELSEAKDHGSPVMSKVAIPHRGSPMPSTSASNDTPQALPVPATASSTTSTEEVPSVAAEPFAFPGIATLTSAIPVPSVLAGVPVVSLAPKAPDVVAVAAANLIEDDGGIKLTVLCRVHNPEFQKLETAKKVAALKARVDALPIESRIRIRAGGAMFDVTLNQSLAAHESVLITFDDGKKSEVKWKHIVWPDSPEVVRKKEAAALKAATAENIYVYENRPIAPTKRSSYTMAPVGEPYQPYPYTMPSHAYAPGPPPARAGPYAAAPPPGLPSYASSRTSHSSPPHPQAAPYPYAPYGPPPPSSAGYHYAPAPPPPHFAPYGFPYPPPGPAAYYPPYPPPPPPPTGATGYPAPYPHGSPPAGSQYPRHLPQGYSAAPPDSRMSPPRSAHPGHGQQQTHRSPPAAYSASGSEHRSSSISNLLHRREHAPAPSSSSAHAHTFSNSDAVPFRPSAPFL